MTNPRTKDYDMYNELSIEELAQISANSGADSTIGRLTRFAYEQKTIEKQDRYGREQIELQHQRNKENIDYQHSLNEKIIAKQMNLMKKTTCIAAASTLVAALAGAYLAYALTQTQKPLQIKLDSEQFAQLRKATTVLETGSAQKLDKSPSSPPSK